MKILLYKGAGIAAPYIVNSVAKALKKNGHRVRIVYLKSEQQDISRELTSFTPDLVIALDSTGLDTKLLSSHKVYYCSWFVDNPRYFITQNVDDEFHVGAYSDRSFKPILKKLGFRHQIYLPLAFDSDLFYKDPKPHKYIADISYVGSYAGIPTSLREKREATLSPAFNTIIETALLLLKQNKADSFGNILKMAEQDLNISFLEELDLPLIGGMLSHIDMAFDVWNKTEFYKTFKKNNLHIYGNPLWQDLDNDNKCFKGAIEYEKSLADIYRQTKINIVLTRPQISNGVNQRVFDIPAVNAFMLCDYRDELKNIFPDCWQQISYHNFNELKGKIDYYMTHENERLNLSNLMHNTIITNHSYTSRMNHFIEDIQKILTKS